MSENTGVATVGTDSGMLCLWSSAGFRVVDGYEAWESQVNDRLAQIIETGLLVPVNIQSDGVFGVRVAIDPPALTDRENAFAVITSDPYLLVVDDAELCLSGIEGVGDIDRAPLRFTIADGRYAVRTTIVAWDEDPESRDTAGNPTAAALPDFVLQIEPAPDELEFRTSEVTFDKPK